MNPDQAERPRTRRSEIRQGRQRPREELSRHHLEAARRGTPDGHAQRPKRPAVTVLGALLVEPVAVKAHKIVEPLLICVECVMKKSAASCAQGSPAFLVLSQFIKQYREDKCSGIIVGAISFGKIGDAENSVLENSR